MEIDTLLWIVGIAAAVGLVLYVANQKPDTTTSEDIAEATKQCVRAIKEAEELVGKHAPHDEQARLLLDKARYCRRFTARHSRLVVSAVMIKRKRLEGVGYASQAADIARAARDSATRN